MDVVLGVAVTGPRARLALVGSGGSGAALIDEYAVDLFDNPIEKLTETVVGTNRLLADENHRLLATRLCWSDRHRVDELRRALEDSGVLNVAVLSESQATGALSVPGTATATMQAQAADDPTLLLARGAALAAGLAGDATAMAPAVGLDGGATAMTPAVPGTYAAGQVGPDLAYSMAGESDLLPMEWLTEPEDDDAETGPVGLTSRRLGAMDAVLGIAVAGSVARLALVGPVGGGYAAIKHLVVELPVQPFETLIQTVAGFQQSLADEGRHLVATRLYSPDPAQAEALRRALADSGVPDVGLVSQAEAVTSLLRTVFRGAALPGAVALVVTAEAATLVALGAADALASVVATAALQGVDAAAATVDMVLEWLRSAPFAVDAAYVLGSLEDLTRLAEELRARSPLRVEVLERPDFAFARGAALAAGLAPITPQPPITAGLSTAMAPAVGLAGAAAAMAPGGDETAFAPAAEPAVADQQLAYSLTDQDQPLGVDEYGDEDFDDDPETTATGRAPLSRRSLVLGNAVIAFAVIGFATLAAAVAIAVRPTASAQPVIGHQNAAPGKFMPLLPTQQQAPVPAPPPDAPWSGFQGGVVPDANGYIPPQLASPGGGAPAPVPAFVPNPDPGVPMPVPVIVPYPGWQPPYNPYPNGPTTTTPPTTTTTPPTTTTTPPTTTTTPPTTSTTPPTTTTPTTTTTPPTTTPPTTAAATTPPTTVAPKATTAAPAPTTQAPAPTPTQQPAPTQAPAPKPTQAPVPKPVTPQLPATPLPTHH